MLNSAVKNMLYASQGRSENHVCDERTLSKDQYQYHYHYHYIIIIISVHTTQYILPQNLTFVPGHP